MLLDFKTFGHKSKYLIRSDVDLLVSPEGKAGDNKTH